MPNVADRLLGATSTLGCKAPVQAATTANITLSGEQTVDGVALTEGDRCLVKDQTDATENGIYEVATSTWALAKDFDGTGDWRKGTIIPVAAGTVNVGTVWRVSSADPDSIGEDDVDFEQLDFTSVEVSDSVATGSSINLNSVDAEIVSITGSGATITTISVADGVTKIVRFEGANTLTHSSSLVLPGSLNIATAAGDIAMFCGYASSVVRCAFYSRADSHPLIAGEGAIVAAATVNLGSVREQCVTISGATTITSFGSSAPTGATKFCRLSGAPLITASANIITPDGGASIQGASGDCFIARHEGSGVWRVLNYTRAAMQNASVTTQTPNASTAGEVTLLSHTIPAGRLSSSSAAIRVIGWGITSTSTAANKRARLFMGADSVADTGSIALAGGTWMIDTLICRTSSTGAHAALGRAMFSTGAAGVAGSSQTLLISAPTADVSGAVVMSLAGTATGSTGGITAYGLVVQHLSV